MVTVNVGLFSLAILVIHFDPGVCQLGNVAKVFMHHQDGVLTMAPFGPTVSIVVKIVHKIFSGNVLWKRTRV